MNSPTNRVIRLGHSGSYERTNPDYIDDKIARLTQDYEDCPKEWRKTFLAGLQKKDAEEILRRTEQKQ